MGGDVGAGLGWFVGGDVGAGLGWFVGGDVGAGLGWFVGGDIGLRGSLYVGGDVGVGLSWFVGGEVGEVVDGAGTRVGVTDGAAVGVGDGAARIMLRTPRFPKPVVSMWRRDDLRYALFNTPFCSYSTPMALYLTFSEGLIMGSSVGV